MSISRLIPVGCLVLFCGVIRTEALGQLPAVSGTGPSQFEDSPTPLDPKTARSEAEQDRIHAAALYASGRILQRRGNAAAALRRYQRAYRYDPAAREMIIELIPLAFSIGRTQEAARYALLGGESNLIEPKMLSRLAHWLTQQGQWQSAQRLYRMWSAAREGESPSVDHVRVWLASGRLYFLEGDLKSAASAFGKVDEALADRAKFGVTKAVEKEIVGNAALTYRLFGECYLAAAQTDRARAAFRKSNEARPSPGRFGYDMARVLAAEEKTVEAIDSLDAYFQEQLSTEVDRPYQLLAELLSDLNQQDSVTERITELHAADAENVPLAVFLADRYMENEQLDQADEIIAALAKLPAEQLSLDVLNSRLRLALKLKKPERLLEALQAAAVAAGTLDAFQEKLAPLVADAALIDQLFAAARERAKLEPGKAAGLFQAVAEVAILAKQFDASKEFYDRALVEQPKQSQSLLLSWGLGLFLADQYERAAAVFQRGLDGKPAGEGGSSLLFFLAGALEMAGKTDQALEAAMRAAAEKPDSAQLANRVAWILYHAKRYDEAIKAHLAILKKFDGQHDSQQVRESVRSARLMLSNLYVLSGDLPKAEEALEEVLDEFPEHIGALNDLGYLWADQGKHLERALRMVEKAVATEPENKAYLDSLGWANYRLGRFEQAVRPLEKAAAGEDTDGVVLDHLGDVYQQLGKRKKALQSWQRALSQFEKDAEKEKAERTRKKLKTQQE